MNIKFLFLSFLIFFSFNFINADSRKIVNNNNYDVLTIYIIESIINAADKIYCFFTYQPNSLKYNVLVDRLADDLKNNKIKPILENTKILFQNK